MELELLIMPESILAGLSRCPLIGCCGSCCFFAVAVVRLAAALWNLGVRVKWLEDPAAVQAAANSATESPPGALSKRNSAQSAAAQSGEAAAAAAATAAPATAAAAAAN